MADISPDNVFSRASALVANVPDIDQLYSKVTTLTAQLKSLVEGRDSDLLSSAPVGLEFFTENHPNVVPAESLESLKPSTEQAYMSDEELRPLGKLSSGSYRLLRDRCLEALEKRKELLKEQKKQWMFSNGHMRSNNYSLYKFYWCRKGILHGRERADKVLEQKLYEPEFKMLFMIQNKSGDWVFIPRILGWLLAPMGCTESIQLRTIFCDSASLPNRLNHRNHNVGKRIDR